MSEPLVVRLSASETLPLRSRVLRSGRPPAECMVEGDDAPTTVHFGVKIANEIIGIATLLAEPSPTAPTRPGYRLRGMATAPEVRGGGHGKALVRACLEHAARNGGEIFWCNARTTAAGFYERLGLRAFGPPFDLPGIGPHVRMVRDLR